ncbi:MAG: hypothetical protein COV36_05390, partial [Alphaproteobacteria bacterium CG11_big_fil_rev_8_21_14_0_20_44_7]
TDFNLWSERAADATTCYEYHRADTGADRIGMPSGLKRRIGPDEPIPYELQKTLTGQNDLKPAGLFCRNVILQI